MRTILALTLLLALFLVPSADARKNKLKLRTRFQNKVQPKDYTCKKGIALLEKAAADQPFDIVASFFNGRRKKTTVKGVCPNGVVVFTAKCNRFRPNFAGADTSHSYVRFLTGPVSDGELDFDAAGALCQ